MYDEAKNFQKKTLTEMQLINKQFRAIRKADQAYVNKYCGKSKLALQTKALLDTLNNSMNVTHTADRLATVSPQVKQ